MVCNQVFIFDELFLGSTKHVDHFRDVLAVDVIVSRNEEINVITFACRQRIWVLFESLAPCRIDELLSVQIPANLAACQLAFACLFRLCATYRDTISRYTHKFTFCRIIVLAGPLRVAGIELTNERTWIRCYYGADRQTILDSYLGLVSITQDTAGIGASIVEDCSIEQAVGNVDVCVCVVLGKANNTTQVTYSRACIKSTGVDATVNVDGAGATLESQDASVP